MTTLFLFGELMRSNYVQDYDKWVKAGRGQGRYSAYDPWITVQDCHSKTPRHRVPCPRLHRMLHCLSHGERLVCLSPRRTQPVSKCNSPVNPGCSILRGQSTLAHSPPSPSQFFTPIANVGANSFKQRSTDRARFRFFDACSCS